MTTLETLTLGRKNGLTPAAMHSLLAILSDPPMRPSRIAEITGMTTASVTGSIDRLERCGMVERMATPRGDRRTKPISPSKIAFELFANL